MPTRKTKTPLIRIEDDLVYDMLSKLSDKVDNVSTNVAELDKKLEIQAIRTDKRLEAVEALDRQQNELLREHHDRSVQLKRDNELREQTLRSEILPRIEKLEVPRKWLEHTKDALLWCAAACGGVVAIKEVWNLLQR